MLLSEIVGATVVTTTERELGRVHDVLLVQDGPVGANGRAGLRLHALAVGPRAFGAQLGYVQGTVAGPWLLRKLLGRQPHLVPWDAIVERTEDRIVADESRVTAYEAERRRRSAS